MSTDEKTGMQALERLHETKPVRPGLVERVEFEYVRHGTLSLIANFDVVTGKVVSPSIGRPARKRTSSPISNGPSRSRPIPAQALQLHLPRRSALPHGQVPRLPQRRAREAVPLDLHREATSGVTGSGPQYLATEKMTGCEADHPAGAPPRKCYRFFNRSKSLWRGTRDFLCLQRVRNRAPGHDKIVKR